MELLKVTSVANDTILFDNGYCLGSEHEQDCCESHYLSTSDLTLEDFEGLEFDLDRDDFFERIEGYGIALKPVNGHPVRIPAYGQNNGYYSANLSLVIINLKSGKVIKSFDITHCQKIKY